MNIQEYISSGIVESYVLGLAEPAERAEFERLCLEFPELVAARDSFEILLEQQAMADAITPPAEMEGRIFAAINPASAAPVADSTAPVVQMDTTAFAPISLMRRLRFVAAACVILLVASTILNFYFFKQYKDYSALYRDLLSSNEQIARANTVLQARVQSYETDLAVIRDRDMVIVPMPGTNVPTSPDKASLATVYWNQRTKDVYLLVNNMPKPAADKQYQLWALVDGKPVNAGLFDPENPSAIVRMNNIRAAQGFAITLEKKGGAESPTMEMMYVLGNVKT